ncbi:hypothetical protein LTR36_007283 [Oleoguttula mirabilis]|uniref:Sensory transduction histidine kinase n=1 Tax=Oleoguttula mirabilis TaxID=1507867 RepID=A0AAV9J9Y0_9PEZI|nr:hypothetical protein LTR36_007283 [Oleoguttula mirabilis]
MSNNSNSSQPSIFTPRDSFVNSKKANEAGAKAAAPPTSSPFRRQSTPDNLESHRIQAVLAAELAVSQVPATLKPLALSLATSHPNCAAFTSTRAQPARSSTGGFGFAESGGRGGAHGRSYGQEQRQRRHSPLDTTEGTTTRPPPGWAPLAPGSTQRGSPGARGRSASVSHAKATAAVGTAPIQIAPSKTPVAAAQGDRDKRKRPEGAEVPTAEPSTKRPRFRGPRTKHTLDGFNFGPSTFNQPAPQPPSPLFFSNSPRPRPQLPPRFSSSEAAARMLSKTRNEDSHVKTVSLARGTVPTPVSSYPAPSMTPTSMPRSDANAYPSRRSIDRNSNRSDSPETMFSLPSGGSVNDSGPMGGMLSNIGVTELLELDERPTFIVDLADSRNYGPGLLHLVFSNSSLRSVQGMLEFVTGTTHENTSPGPKTYLQFKSWLLSASVHGESLNVCLPSFVYAGMTWSCSTLRKRLRIISGAFSATPPASAPTSGSIAQSFAKTQAPQEPVTYGAPAEEPADYFAGALLPPSLRPVPSDGMSSTKTDVVPTIEATTPMHDPESARDLIAKRFDDSLSAAADLLRSSHTYLNHSLGAFVGETADGDALMRTATNSTVDSARSIIPAVTSNAPSFDWTRLPVSDSMPQHIQFARSIDWASTSLGRIEDWSPDLRQMCNLIMASPHPAAMYWGQSLVAIYNEAYILLAGQKHPSLMGQSYAEAWSEIWHDVKDVFDSAKNTGEATMKDDDCLFIKRHSYLEETYFSWSIIPMVGQDGSVVGLYNPAFEKTRRKIAERRMLTLREVGERTASARDVKGFWAQVLSSFEFNEYDSPFLVLYSVADEADSDSSSMHSMSAMSSRSCFLEGALGVPEGHPAASDQIDLKAGMEGFGPVFREVMKTDKPVLLEVGSRDLPHSLIEGLEFRGFGDPVRAVVVCPIHPTTGDTTLGFLVLGVNPRRPYDDDYGLFVQLLSRQLATSLASVVLFEEEIRRGQKAAKLAALDRIELSEQLAARTQEAIESETRFTRMAEFAPVGMFIADHSGRITFANDTWYDISRVPRDHTLSTADEQWMEAVSPADREHVKRLWAELLSSRNSVSSEFRFKAQWEDRSGTRTDTWVLFSAYPEKYRDGRLKGVFGSITNISQQKWAEGIQTRKMEEAMETKRQQENFIDITSHEMRNPLSAILQCSDEIASSLTKLRDGGEKVVPDELISSCLDAAQIISLCSQHQKRIVDDILTLSKLDSQLLLVTPVPAQPLLVVQRALKMHEGELQAADISMKLVVDQSFQDMELDWVRFDPSRVLQVLINLTTNAIKFTGTEKKRTITVTIAASRQKKPNNYMEGAPVQYFPTRSKRKYAMSEPGWGRGEPVLIHFSVEDTGRGLNPEEKKMLFLRFSQASPRTHITYGGSGLGLFISRELTELQGGEIGVESEAGKGSTFAFYVAARRSTAPPDADSQGRVGPSAAMKKAGVTANGTASPQPALQKKVLIVEDNLVNQRVLQKQLKNLGTEVHLANHGGEALEKLKQSTYWAGGGGGSGGRLELGVVLMDQEMPFMDGLTCTRKIRELEREGKLTGHIPIIAVTANARAEQVQTALDAGMDDVVSKPFRINELMPKIEELMERYPMPRAVP